MKTAIIGAGFVGRELAKVLTRQGCTPVLYDQMRPSDNDLDFVELNILTQAPDFSQGVDVVFYLAQSPFYRDFPSNAQHLFGVNTHGAVKSAEAAKNAGCKFFFYASTGNVYQPSFVSQKECFPLNRENAYTLSKIHGEEVLNLFRPFMNVVCGRIFGVFGPGQKRMLAAQLYERIKNDVPITLFPARNGDQEGLKISFIFVTDLAFLLYDLARKAMDRTQLPHVMNLAGERSVSIKEFALEIGRMIGKTPLFELSREPRYWDLSADISILSTTLHPTFTPFECAVGSSYASD